MEISAFFSGAGAACFGVAGAAVVFFSAFLSLVVVAFLSQSQAKAGTATVRANALAAPRAMFVSS